MALSLLVGCGRIGIDYLELGSNLSSDAGSEQSPAHEGEAGKPALEPALGPDAGAEESSPATGWNGGPSTSDGRRDGAVPAAWLDAGSDAGSMDAAPAAINDASEPMDAAAAPVDAAGAVPPEAGAPDLACSEFGLIACEDFNGHRSGTDVTLAGAALLTGGFVTAQVSPGVARAAAHVFFEGISDGALYLRFSLYVPSNVPLLGLTIARLGRLDVRSDFGFDLRAVRDGELELSTSAGVQSGMVGYKLPRDRWLCVLAQTDVIDRDAGIIVASIDGTPVASASNVNTEPVGGIVAAATAIEDTFNGQGAASVYVDNVLLASQPPPPCP